MREHRSGERRGLIVVEPSRRRGPFDPRWTDVPRRRHLRLVPELAEADVPAPALGGAETTESGLALVTYLRTAIPSHVEYDRDFELDGHDGEDPSAGRVAAVLPVPRL